MDRCFIDMIAHQPRVQTNNGYKITPHEAFQIMRPDEVAECWDGVSDDMYAALWTVAAKQKPLQNREDSGPHDHIGVNCVADAWHSFTFEQQAALNALAERSENQ